jgi:hypothetical protein
MAMKPVDRATSVSENGNGHKNGKLVISESKDFRWSTDASASPVTAKSEPKKKAKSGR